MKIIEPIAMTDGQLTVASIVEDDAPEWDAAIAYVLNDRVISRATHSLYVCEVNNTGMDPDTTAVGTWTRLSATNRWKAFDTYISDPATATGSISYTVTPDTPVYGIAFFGLVANQIDITVTLGAQVLTYTTSLIDYDDIDGWHSWLFSGVQSESEALQLDLPYLGVGTTYKIDITGTGTVQVGQIVLGVVTGLGVTLWGAGVSIQDYSRKDQDVFGNFNILERGFSRTASFPIGFETGLGRRVQRKLAKFRAKPVVWIGDERPGYALIVYGFYSEYSHVLDFDNWSRGFIDIKGLT